MTNRITVTFLARTLGTSNDWDGDPDECLVFSGFEAASGVDLPDGDLQIAISAGDILVFPVWDGKSEGTPAPLAKHDIVTFLTNVPRDPA